jgi:hypothetical protein
LNFLCILSFKFEQSYALSTTFSRIEGCVSSSSDRHKIWPIYARVRPLLAPFLSRVEAILKFLKHSGRILKFYSSSATSLSMSNRSMYSKVF